MSVCEIVLEMCLALLDQMVENNKCSKRVSQIIRVFPLKLQPNINI